MIDVESDQGGEPAVILVVEDEEPIRLALSEILEAEGYAVVGACDGSEALAVVDRIVPALIITDLQMPRIDGSELCRRLRESSATREIPLVVLTASHRAEQAVGNNADAIVRKPFDIDALVSTIAQFIRTTIPPRPSAVAASGRHRSMVPRRADGLVLYVTPGSTACERAQRSLRALLDGDVYDDVRPHLEVVDVTSDRERARNDGVVMTPTLVRIGGERRDLFVGDLSDTKVLRAFLMRLE